MAAPISSAITPSAPGRKVSSCFSGQGLRISKILNKAKPNKNATGSRPAGATASNWAATSSINAHKIKRFKKGGKRWVRFEVVGKQGQRIAMERPVVRTVRIKRFGQESTRRTVVRIGICVGSYYKDAQVTLQDRSRRAFPVLIRRRYMAGAVIIDPGRDHLTRPNCPERARRSSK